MKTQIQVVGRHSSDQNLLSETEGTERINQLVEHRLPKLVIGV